MATINVSLLVIVTAAIATVVSQSTTGEYGDEFPSELQQQVAQLEDKMQLILDRLHDQGKQLRKLEEVQTASKISLTNLEENITIILDRVRDHERQMNRFEEVQSKIYCLGACRLGKLLCESIFRIVSKGLLRY